MGLQKLYICTPSLATEWIKGKQLSDAAKIKNSDIAKVPKLLLQLWSCITCVNKFLSSYSESGAVPSSSKAALLHACRGRHPGCPEGLQSEAGEDSSQLGYCFSQVLADKDIPIVILSS